MLTTKEEYKNRNTRCRIRCTAHNEIFEYSLISLQGYTSCACPRCRTDPKHQNRAVDNVRRINGRPGQKIDTVYVYFKNTTTSVLCQLQLLNFITITLDGQDFYAETALSWNENGICLCGTVHRDYHNNFLKNHSLIAKEYSSFSFFEIQHSTENVFSMFDPDENLDGIEVSRYTFCEYLRFLCFDIQKNNSVYVKSLNEKIEKQHFSFVKSSTKKGLNSKGEWSPITLEKLVSAYNTYCEEYKGENWAFATTNLPFANDVKLWEKVEKTWNI